MKLALAIVLALITGNQSAIPQTSAEALPGLPAAVRPLSLRWTSEDGPRWDALMEAFSHAVERPVFLHPDAYSYLGFLGRVQPKGSKFTYLGVDPRLVADLADQRTLDVAVEEVYFEFESLLEARGLALVPLCPVEPATGFQVVSLVRNDGSARRLNWMAVTRFLSPEAVQSYRRHPAVLIATYLPLSKETSAKTLESELSHAFERGFATRVTALDNGLFVSGRSPFVCEVADVVNEVDRCNARGDRVERSALRGLIAERFLNEGENE